MCCSAESTLSLILQPISVHCVTKASPDIRSLRQNTTLAFQIHKHWYCEVPFYWNIITEEQAHNTFPTLKATCFLASLKKIKRNSETNVRGKRSLLPLRQNAAPNLPDPAPGRNGCVYEFNGHLFGINGTQLFPPPLEGYTVCADNQLAATITPERNATISATVFSAQGLR